MKPIEKSVLAMYSTLTNTVTEESHALHRATSDGRVCKDTRRAVVFALSSIMEFIRLNSNTSPDDLSPAEFKQALRDGVLNARQHQTQHRLDALRQRAGKKPPRSVIVEGRELSETEAENVGSDIVRRIQEGV